jgi:hypothetical protein
LVTIALLLETEVFMRWGFPQKILTDKANEEAYVPTEPEEGPNPPRVGDLVYNRNHPFSEAADK